MRETELKILFPTERLEALRFFIGKKELAIEQELKDYLDKTYEKVVPAHVREYVESRIGQDPGQEQAQTPEPEVQVQQPEPQRETRQPRQSRRQREQATVESNPTPDGLVENEAPAEEENQGMSMNM